MHYSTHFHRTIHLLSGCLDCLGTFHLGTLQRSKPTKGHLGTPLGKIFRFQLLHRHSDRVPCKLKVIRSKIKKRLISNCSALLFYFSATMFKMLLGFETRKMSKTFKPPFLLPESPPE